MPPPPARPAAPRPMPLHSDLPPPPAVQARAAEAQVVESVLSVPVSGFRMRDPASNITNVSLRRCIHASMLGAAMPAML